MFSWKRFWIAFFGGLGTCLIIPALIYGFVGIFWLANYLFGPDGTNATFGFIAICAVIASIVCAVDYGFRGDKSTNSTGPR
jgi:preprotein translocase subunit SecE